MTVFDIVIVVAYLVAMLILGWYVGKDNKSGEDYFAGGRSMPWYAIGFSVGATFISAGTFIGGPGWAYYDGIVAAMINFGVPLGAFFATYYILPIIYKSRVTTVYEYLSMRFGTKTRIVGLTVWAMNALIYVGGVVYIPCLVMEAMTGISIDIWVPIIIVMSIIYTVAGGIKAVIWSDLIQSIVLIFGIIISVYTAVNVINMPLSEALQIGRDAGMMVSYNFSFDPTVMSIWGVAIAGTLFWGGYFAFSQTQVQRYITAKNIVTIKKTNVFAIVVIQGIYWIAHLLGVVLYAFYQTNVNTLDFTNSNNVMIDFVLNYMPQGLKGIIVAATFAAAMSTIDSTLNCVSAVFVKDIYEPFISKKPDTPMRVNIIASIAVSVVIIGFVYMYLNDGTSSVLLAAGNLMGPFGGLPPAIMICCFFIPKINDKSMLTGALVAFAAIFTFNRVSYAFYLNVYMAGTLIAVLVAYLAASTIFKDENEQLRTYQYGFAASKKSLVGQTDSDGCSLELGKIDIYGWTMIALFVVQCVVLWALQ